MYGLEKVLFVPAVISGIPDQSRNDFDLYNWFLPPKGLRVLDAKIGYDRKSLSTAARGRNAPRLLFNCLLLRLWFTLLLLPLLPENSRFILYTIFVPSTGFRRRLSSERWLSVKNKWIFHSRSDPDKLW